MVSFLEGVRNANKAINCFLLGAGGNILGGVARLPGGSPEFIQNTTKALRRLAGCDPADDPVNPPPPFTGGQCPAVKYNVTLRWILDGVPAASVTIGLLGPLGGLTVTQNTASSYTRSMQAGGRFTLIGASCGPVTDNVPGTKDLGSVSSNQTITAEVVSVVRCDGDPDTCGDPPPVFPPPTPINIDIDVTYNTDEGDEVTVTIPFIYAPITTDIYGNFRIPFIFEFGDIEFSGNVSLEPNFNVTINPPPAPRGTDSPLTDLPAPEDEIPVEPSTFAERVVGVVVQSALIGEQQLTTIFTENIPQILAPRCGSVKFGYAIADRSFWSPDIDIKDLNCFIPCPFSQGADTVAASPAPGVVLSYVPIFGAPLATVADLGSTPEP